VTAEWEGSVMQRAAGFQDARDTAVMGEEGDSEVFASFTVTSDMYATVRAQVLGTGLPPEHVWALGESLAHVALHMLVVSPPGTEEAVLRGLFIKAALVGYHARRIKEEERDHG
jgi:hypothetical protein